jgi:hypothetical protein
MEDVQEAAAAQATPQEAQQEAQTDDMEEERAPHMQWTYKVLMSSVAPGQILDFCFTLQVCAEWHANLACPNFETWPVQGPDLENMRPPYTIQRGCLLWQIRALQNMSPPPYEPSCALISADTDFDI